jgi:electron transport complex protein RnfE
MRIFFNPVSQQNFLLPVLGICPLLIVADTWEKALGTGILFAITITLTSLLLSLLRGKLAPAVHLTVIVIISATVVTLLHLLMQFRLYELSLGLGIYIPLLAMNSLLLACVEEHGLRQGARGIVLNNLRTGLSVTAVLVLIASIREYAGLIFLKHPSGTFFLLALFLALYNFIVASRVPSST